MAAVDHAVASRAVVGLVQDPLQQLSIPDDHCPLPHVVHLTLSTLSQGPVLQETITNIINKYDEHRR